MEIRLQEPRDCLLYNFCKHNYRVFGNPESLTIGSKYVENIHHMQRTTQKFE